MATQSIATSFPLCGMSSDTHLVFATSRTTCDMAMAHTQGGLCEAREILPVEGGYGPTQQPHQLTPEEREA